MEIVDKLIVLLKDPMDIVTLTPDVENDWRLEGTCFGTRDPAFFPSRGDSTKVARAMCIECPVLQTCRDYAVGNNEKFGVWGGTTERQRSALRKEKFDAQGKEEKA